MGVSHALTPAALTASGVIRAHTKGAMRQKSRTWLTNLSSKVFSLSAPMQPAKPRMNITPPTTMKSHTGSKPPRSVIDDRLDSTPWGGEERRVTNLTNNQQIHKKINPSSRVVARSMNVRLTCVV